jgi:stage V sporulation protein B
MSPREKTVAGTLTRRAADDRSGRVGPPHSPEVPPHENTAASAPPNTPGSIDPQLSASEARSAGRGGLAIAGAKVWFILAGFVQQTLLPHFIGMDGYGAFSSVLSFANIPNNVVTTASIQGVSRAVAGAPEGQEEVVQRRTFLIHLGLAPILAIIFAALAPAAAAFEHAPHLLGPLRIFAAVLFIYGIYTPLVGALNGRRRFLAQAGLDVTFATLRTIGLLGAAFALTTRLDGPTASAIGVAVAAAAVLPIAWAVAGNGRAGTSGPSVGAHLAIIAPIAVAQFFSNILMQADIWLLRRFVHESGARAGVAVEALQRTTDGLVGSYRAAQLFAFLPYQLLLSITFILFPMLARAHARRETKAVNEYVRAGFRLALILAGFMVSCTSGLGPQLLRFAFPREAADQASETLRILALGQGAFAIFGIEATILVSLSREVWSAIVTAVASFLVAALCWVLVPAASFDSSLLVRTGTATSIALALAAITGGFLVRRVAGPFVSLKTLVRVAIALAAAIALGSRLPLGSRWLSLLEAPVVAGSFILVCVLSGELSRGDLSRVTRALGRR